MSSFQLALNDFARAWPALTPPSRMPVSQGMAKNLVIKRPGGGGGNYNPDETPYMVKPANLLASRVYSAVCFVGPAQSGKTLTLGEGWMTHAVLNDPGDMLIVQMTQDKAREYSKQRIDRAIRNSPNLKAARSAVARDDNLHDKQFRNGMWLRIAWPTATNLSSTSYRYAFGTDYDRWPDDIDGEGDGFTLMGKRTTTFLSRGMTAVESSPGRPIKDPGWRPATPHEAPPVDGILGIYNRGDRQRWPWKCVHCGEWFEAKPGLSLFPLPSDDELIEDVRNIDIAKFAKQHAYVPCPHCGTAIGPEHRDAMNRYSAATEWQGWLPEGLTVDSHDRLSGTPRTSSIASFWLGGCAAAYVTWQQLIAKHLQALLQYSLTGSELELQSTINTDQCMPYMPRALVEAGKGTRPGDIVEADLQRYIVPNAARFVVVMVDVQGGQNARFVVQAHAVGPYKERWLIDRYSITESERAGTDDRPAPIDPASYPEDWDVLTKRLVGSTYRLEDGERELKVRLIVVDTGGEGDKKAAKIGDPKKGVTNNAYAWYRRLRKQRLHDRVRLTKGASTRADWLVRETWVGGQQGKGDVPLYLLEPNKFKDDVDAGLRRKSPGPGYYHFPAPKGPANPDGWLLPAFFDELQAEVRNESGVWEQIRKRNEAFDLAYMEAAGCNMLGVDKKGFWDNPPRWALPFDAGNTDVVEAGERRAEKAATQAAVDQAPAAAGSMRRALGQSPYLG